jgi:hypothetical protein
MSRDPDYTPFAGKREKTPPVRETLWTLRKGVRRVRAELQFDGPLGVEFRLVDGGEFLYGRRFPSAAEARAFAADDRADRERDGWQSDEAAD